MTRTVIFLYIGWTAVFLPAMACYRNTDLKTPAIVPAVRAETIPADTSGPKYSYLALGDSYTIATSIRIFGAYPMQTVQQLNNLDILFSRPEILATNGWTTTNLLDALASHPPADTFNIVTLLIGVNNQYQGGSLDNYRDQFTQLLDKSIAFAGNRPARVIVLSIPDYSVTPFGLRRPVSGISDQIDAFNKANREITLARGAQYVDITNQTRIAGTDPVLLASDNLHYSAAEYELWAEKLVPLFRKALGR